MNALTYILIAAALVVLCTISSGIYLMYKGCKGSDKKLKKVLKVNLTGFIPTMAAALIMFAPTAVSAAVDSTATNSNAGLGYLGAALATGLACIGAGYGVGVLGSASLGAISENEKMFGRTLIYVGLAEGLAIYGLIISIMILGNLG